MYDTTFEAIVKFNEPEHCCNAVSELYRRGSMLMMLCLTT